MRYPNLRYGKHSELAYYAAFLPLPDLARMLRRDERTVRDWISGRTRVPWWVPEILRLKRLESDVRHRQMCGKPLATRLGVVDADVIPMPAHARPRTDQAPQGVNGTDPAVRSKLA